MRGTKRRLFVAPVTGVFVLLMATCALAPLGAAGAALGLALTSPCPEADHCGGSSCLRAPSPRPSDSDCRSCGAQSGFLVEERRAAVVPSVSFAIFDEATPVTAFQAAAAVRLVAVAASPPLNLLLATFRN
jgi:hypothetical protein